MLWPALRVLARGELSSERIRHLLTTLRLEENPRSEGPGASMSLAHRTFTDDTGTRLVLDLGRADESGWILALFFDGEPPSTDTVEGYRVLLRAAVDRLGLALIEVTPAAAADEVYVAPPPSPDTPEPMILSWDLPYDDLDRMWPHLGLRATAPREVKEVVLREVTRTPAWAVAPEKLRRQAEAFLRSD
ncbi:hypothetical protein ACFRCG_13060 [Embleya sp. NPDC056575]|uniref:hypothetical protein n=1 Tax=unclassified Embleya TaxID=2699296 RepID=UPI0036C1C11E